MFFPVSNLSGIFCLLCGFSGGLCDGDEQGLVVLVDYVDHQLGVLCRGFGIDVVFFAASLCVDFGFLCELLFIDGAHIVSGVADLVSDGMVAGGRGIVLSLRSGSNSLVIRCDCFVRFVLHLLVCSSWCSSVPLAGLLLVDWVVSVRRPATEPGEWKDCPGRSTDKWHAFSMLLMGFEYLFVDSGSGLEFHSGFFFIARDGEGLACGSDGRRWRGSLVLLLWIFM